MTVDSITVTAQNIVRASVEVKGWAVFVNFYAVHNI